MANPSLLVLPLLAGAARSAPTLYVTGGHWSYDGDYVWVSDYPWGWVPFH
jgi:hypothetical protein